MKVTCPHCQTRYRLDRSVEEAEVMVRCPTCLKKFRVVRPPPLDENPLVHKRGERDSAPPGFSDRDFLEVLLSWRVRKTDGSQISFRTLAQLEQSIAAGEVLADDAVSWDRDHWTRIGDIEDRYAWFWDKWQKAEREEIHSLAPSSGEGEDEEDDAPTAMFSVKGWFDEEDTGTKEG